MKFLRLLLVAAAFSATFTDATTGLGDLQGHAQLRTRGGLHHLHSSAMDDQPVQDIGHNILPMERKAVLQAMVSRLDPEERVHMKKRKENNEEVAVEDSKAEEVEEGGEAKEDKHTGRVTALMMLFSVVFGMIIFGMSQMEDPHVKHQTIILVDTIIAIFIAVLWFQAFDELLDDLLPLRFHSAASTIHCLVWIVVSFVVSFLLRKHEVALAMFCGCGGHFVSFASIHMSTHAQESHFSESHHMCLLGFFCLAIAFSVLICLLYVMKKALGLTPGTENPEEYKNTFIEKVDDMEADFVGMALAMYWTLMVLFLIHGEYHGDMEIEPGSVPISQEIHQSLMLLYSFWCLIFGAAISVHLPHAEKLSYWKGRLVNSYRSFIIFCCSFAFLVWGKMEFYEHWSNTPILGRIALAGLSSIMLIVGIFVIAYARRIHGRLATACKGIAVVGLGLTVGLTWEEAFDESCEMAVEEMPHHGLLKAVLALGIAAVIMPIYLSCLKPLSDAAKDELAKLDEL